MFLKKSGQRFKHYWMLLPMFRILLFLFRKEVNEMAIIYATLIVKGKKTFAQVPDLIKDQVKQILIDLECEELAA